MVMRKTTVVEIEGKYFSVKPVQCRIGETQGWTNTRVEISAEEANAYRARLEGGSYRPISDGDLKW